MKYIILTIRCGDEGVGIFEDLSLTRKVAMIFVDLKITIKGANIFGNLKPND